MLIFGKVVGWYSRKFDYVQPFPQIELDDNDHIYMHLLREFLDDDTKYKSGYVLKLKKNLHGFKKLTIIGVNS